MNLKKQFTFIDQNGNLINNTDEFYNKIEIELIEDPKKYKNIFNEIVIYQASSSNDYKYIYFKSNENVKLTELPNKVNSLKMVNYIELQNNKQHTIGLILFISVYFFNNDIQKEFLGFTQFPKQMNDIKKIYTEVYMFDSEFDIIQEQMYPSIDLIKNFNFIYQYHSSVNLIKYDITNSRPNFITEFGNNDVTTYSSYKEILNLF